MGGAAPAFGAWFSGLFQKMDVLKRWMWSVGVRNRSWLWCQLAARRQQKLANMTMEDVKTSEEPLLATKGWI
jgi:hypothetical protein